MKLLNKSMSAILFCALVMPVTAMAGSEQVEMPEFAEKHLMKLMRGHLGALQGITQLLSQHKYEKAADLAEERLGMSSVEIHFEKYVGKYMPKDMRAHAEGMHEAATRFAADARIAAKGGELDKALASMSIVIKQCVACHSAYRVRQSEK
jgi:cytochrome c556